MLARRNASAWQQMGQPSPLDRDASINARIVTATRARRTTGRQRVKCVAGNARPRVGPFCAVPFGAFLFS